MIHIDKVLSAGDYATVVVTATAVSIAAASVPSAALVLMLLVLNAIGIYRVSQKKLWQDFTKKTINMKSFHLFAILKLYRIKLIIISRVPS